MTSVSCPAAGTFNRTVTWWLLSAHAVPGLDRVEPAEHGITRWVRVAGQAQLVRVALTEEGVRLSVRDGESSPALIALVRRWLDLDFDPAVLPAAWAGDPTLTPLLRMRPGLRVLGHPDGFEAAITTVIGQHVSVAAARTFAGRLVAAFGTPAGEGLSLFPTADRLAAAEPGDLQAATGVTGARARTVHELARRCAAGWTIDADRDPAELRSELLSVPGIGPWTADYVAVRSGDRDAFPAGDLVLRRALGNASASAVQRSGERWRPYRAYALVHLWADVLGIPG